MHTLKIQHLTVEINGKEILKDFNLEMKSGEIHAIMGPNGTGKSTLAKVIMGDSNYTITKGDILFDGTSIKEMPVDERAHLGIFLGMQMPIEIDGVTNADFLRTAIHAKEKENFKLYPFIKELNETVSKLHMDPSMIHRNVNEGFSGGERKKNEILQLYLLKPNTILLDEIDSGLDVDSLKIVGESVMKYYEEHRPMILVITHYKRLLDYIKPDVVHVMKDGCIVKSGDKTFIDEVEEEGYEHIKNDFSSTCIVKESLKHE